MKAIVVSHKFHPGHLSHLLANYKLLNDEQIDVSFLWNHGFDIFVPDGVDANTSRRRDLFLLDKNDLLVVWFPSVGALFDMILLRFIRKGRIIYVFHEPFDSIMSYLEAGFGIGKTIRIVLASMVNYFLVKCAHKVILPSNKAYETFKLKYSFGGEFIRLPLMFDDESKGLLPIEDRLYISYIGTIAEDHAFDEFVNLIVYCLGLNLFPNVIFLIATRSTLDSRTVSILSEFEKNKRLMIVSGEPMSNRAINEYFSKSIVVWNAYRRSMQSGVLPKAYMLGTPVLVRALNQSEYFTDGETGVEVSKNCSSSDICRAVEQIIKNFAHYSECCRKEFLNSFYYKSLSKDFLSFTVDDLHRK